VAGCLKMHAALFWQPQTSNTEECAKQDLLRLNVKTNFITLENEQYKIRCGLPYLQNKLYNIEE
jgi:hypothetical protein